MPSKDHVRTHRWRIATIEGRRLVVKVIRLTSDWPLLVKVACALAVVIGVFLFQFPLEERGFGVPFALFLASAFAISLMFGRLTGFAAAAVSTVLATEFFSACRHHSPGASFRSVPNRVLCGTSHRRCDYG